MLASFLSLLTLATIASAAFGVGRPLIRALGVAEDDALTVGVFGVAAGLVAAGTFISALGFVGLLYKEMIGVLTLGAAFYGIALLGRACRRRQKTAETEGSQSLKSAAAPPSAPLRQGIGYLAIIAAAGSLIAALAPPTAGDALCYHLELPKRFLLEHSVVYLPDTDNSTYPLLAEMWYLWALALDGPVAAQLLHWGLGVLLALSTVVLATAIVGRPWAWCVGGVVLLVPSVSNQMTAPLNDVALAAMTTLALAAAWRAAIDHEHRGWYVLAGWLAGGALAIKYLAIAYFAAAAVVLLGVAAGRGQRRSLLTGGAAAAVVALAIAGPWYVRSTWYTGNPVHPFFDDVFARLAPALSVSDGTAPSRIPHSAFRTSSTAPRTVLACALAPWQLTMHPENFGGRGHQLGVLFLATLPGLLFCRRLRGLRTLLSIGLLYFVAWYLLRPNARFLLPVVPLLCIAVIWVWMEWRWLPVAPRRCLACATGLVLLAGAAVAPLRARDRLPVALGIESRESFLMRREPSYPAAAWANALVTPEMRILSQEQRAFYFHARVTRENVYRRRHSYDRRLESPDELSRTLQAEGFTHLLLAESSGGIHYNPTLSRLADEALTAGRQSLECLIEYTTEDADGGTRRYRLMALR
ncbi:MAG TPA: hypothetical protein VJ783_01920 [Pirellulales bacterium]|nr:hypothetical protein [Pirellulales bacterium]